MSQPDLFNQLKQTFSEFWSVRDVRERKMLALAAAAVTLGLIYWLLIAPALTGREQFGKKLPALHEQVLQMQALSKEVASYSEQISPVVEPISKDSVATTLARNGLRAKNVAVTGDFVQVEMADVSFSGTVNWLNEMQKTARASTTEARFVPLLQPDRVDVKITLQQRRSQ